MQGQRIRLGALVLGTFLVVCFVQVGDHLPFQSTAGIALGHLSRLELRFWMAHAILLVPGVLLMCWSLAPALADRIDGLWSTCLGLSQRNWLLLACSYFLLLFVLAVVGREVFLLGLPITGDEYAVRFGARILASGRLSVPILEPDGAFVQDFTYRHQGMVSSMEYPGVLLISTLSLISGLGSALYALMAAATGCFVAAAAGTIMGRRGAIVAGIVWLGSPMACVFSMTEHGQLASRFMIAGSLFFYLRIAAAGDRSWSTAAGLALSGTAAFLTRSPEATFILLPIAGHLLVISWFDRSMRRGTAIAAGIAVIGLAFYAWYNIQVTGSWFPPRFSPGVYAVSDLQTYGYLERLGNHLAQNWMLFIVMALGPAGLVFAAFAYAKHSVWLWVLSGSAAGFMCLTLFHDDVGLHDVGPIHLSELTPIAVVVTSVGVLEFVRWLRRAGVRPAEVALPITGYFLCALGVFTLLQSISLRKQADVQALVYDTVNAVVERPALVVGLPPAMARTTRPEFTRAGGWAHFFPHPDPDLADPIIYGRESIRAPFDITPLLERFPDRNVYRIEYGKGDVPVTIVRIR